MTTCAVATCDRESLGPRRREMCEGCYRKRREAGLYRMVDAARVRTHLLGLTRRGWSHKAIGRASGLAHTVVGRIVDGDREQVRPDTARKLLAVEGEERAPTRDKSRPVPALGTWRRVQALAVLGWTRAEVAERAGLAPRSLENRSGGVTAETAAAVARVYDELSGTEGPSPTARDRARARGWAPPLAWDEHTLDDPEAQPELDAAPIEPGYVDEVAVARARSGAYRARDLTRAERDAAIRSLSEHGHTSNRISQQLGVNHATIRQALTEVEQDRTHERERGDDDGLDLAL